LLVTRGRPEQRIPALAKGIDASAVYVSDDFTPFGRRRDDAVRQALGAVALEASGSPYLVSPGRVTKGDGTPYKVFTPFFGAWRKHGWRAPAQSGPDSATWIDPADPTGRDLRAEGAAAEQRFDAWQRGHTGFPIVDAGMRQLAGIGWMHNRVRMIVASFLVKDLHLPWQWGARWFLEQLVDADMANKRWPTISTGGSGPRVAVPTPHRSSGCSTRRRRGRNSIRTARTCGGGCPN
jgi:deoxyribodipyrimidine photolyase